MISLALSSCASSFHHADSRVDEATGFLEHRPLEAQDIESLTFYRQRSAYRLHVYIGVHMVRRLPDGSACASEFTLGLTTNRDLKEFETRRANGAAEIGSTEIRRFRDPQAAARALRSAVEIHDSTIYKRHHALFYLGLAVAPLLGRPCANVALDITSAISESAQDPETDEG